MRYVTIPSPFVVMDPIEDKPVEPREEIPFIKFVRLLCALAAQKTAADTLVLVDIRASAALFSAGDTWVVSDEWHKTLVEQATRLGGWTPAAVLSAGDHVRALVDAPSKDPRGASVAARPASP